jgi:hypothetical protein
VLDRVADVVADLVNDARSLPTLDSVLGVARRKSGNFTVRRLARALNRVRGASG